MVDFNKLIGSISGSGVGAGLAGGVAGGALVSALTTKSGRKAAKSVAQIGGLAAVGALAWNAYKKYQGDKPAEVPPQQVVEQQVHRRHGDGIRPVDAGAAQHDCRGDG